MGTNPRVHTAGGRAIWIALGLALSSVAVQAQSIQSPQGAPQDQNAAAADPVSALRQEIAAMKKSYEERIQALEERLQALEGGAATAAGQAAPNAPAPGTPVAAGEDAELAALRAAASDTAGGAPTSSPSGTQSVPTQASDSREVAFGSERNLSRLNPEISMTGDFVGVATDRGREDFRGREFELNVQSALDPYSLTKWTLSFNPEGEVDVEEGYIAYTGLPGGLTLTAGKFRQSFGALNRWHLHALPQIDYPLALRSYFGDEGLAQTGLSANWLLPHPWASANEVTVELTDGKNQAFGGENFSNLVGLAHLKNFWDIGQATYAELGLSGVAGTNGLGGQSRVWGTDFTLHWQPPQRAKYREITWRSELLRSQRDDPTGVRRNAWGGYSYVESLVSENLYAGLRYDRVEDPLNPSLTTWGVFPNLTWWQSEFVRLRGEYGYLHDPLGGKENRFTLQLTWAAGPHKHETY